MDNATHTLFALTLARTPLGRAGRGTTAALVIASNAPDIDIVTTAGGAINYLRWHRGPTHGPIGIVGLGVIAAGLVWIGRRVIDRRKPATEVLAAANLRPDAPIGMLIVVSMIAALLHVLMDMPTSYGVRPLSPFNWRWFAVDWMPIIDIYLLIALVAGTVGFGRASASSRRRNAAIVLAVMAANYGLRGYAHHQALALVPRVFGPTLAPWCDPAAARDAIVDSWPRPAPPMSPAGRRCLVDVAALPAFGSPFEWRIVAHLSNAYEIRDIDLLDSGLRQPGFQGGAPWRTTLRYPNLWTSEVLDAAAAPLAQVFLGFSRFPAARSFVDAHGETTVRWTDMRFAGAAVPGDQVVNRSNLFTAIIRIDQTGHVVSQSLGR